MVKRREIWRGNIFLCFDLGDYKLSSFCRIFGIINSVISGSKYNLRALNNPKVHKPFQIQFGTPSWTYCSVLICYIGILIQNQLFSPSPLKCQKYQISMKKDYLPKIPKKKRHYKNILPAVYRFNTHTYSKQQHKKANSNWISC